MNEWVQGFFDPTDFIITDPLGRRLGYSAATGALNETSGAFYSGDGLLRQFLIPLAIPGLYKIELFGLGEEANFGIASKKYGVGMERQYLGSGESRVIYFLKEVEPGGMGDVDGDGDVDADDVTFLAGIIPRFASGSNDPGDLNGDGILDQSDVTLLQRLTEVVNASYPQIVTSRAEPVPVISVWGLLMMCGTLILIGTWRIRRNRERWE
ncbi:MAG: hypothetical protein IPG06_16825 [Haliea sp.]|nr:hypothetical protein [Haliea sp.]